MRTLLIWVCMRQASAASDSDPKKGKGLANKVMKMKEDITREVLNRATAMADREERAVLMTAVNALNKSDTTRALKVRLPFPVHHPPLSVRFCPSKIIPCAWLVIGEYTAAKRPMLSDTCFVRPQSAHYRFSKNA